MRPLAPTLPHHERHTTSTSSPPNTHASVVRLTPLFPDATAPLLFASLTPSPTTTHHACYPVWTDADIRCRAVNARMADHAAACTAATAGSTCSVLGLTPLFTLPLSRHVNMNVVYCGLRTFYVLDGFMTTTYRRHNASTRRRLCRFFLLCRSSGVGHDLPPTRRAFLGYRSPRTRIPFLAAQPMIDTAGCLRIPGAAVRPHVVAYHRSHFWPPLHPRRLPT